MQVQRPVHLDSHHGHPPAGTKPIQSNGIHSTSGSNHTASANGHSNDEGMNPYNPRYASGQDGSQQRQYSTQQLPPLYPGMNNAPMPAPGMAAPNPGGHPTMYPLNTLAQANPPVPRQPQQMTKIGSNDKYTFELKVEQQPQRARMCGFGDKDRRPITPPPAVLLVIRHKDSNELVNVDELEGNYYVLSVDLWDQDATQEQSIVRSSSSSPAVSISSATLTSYPPTHDRTPEYPVTVTYTRDGTPMVHQSQPGYPGQVPYGLQAPPYGYSGAYGGVPPGAHPHHMYPPPSAASGGPSNPSMFTKNLIGSLVVNAAQLKDINGKLGLWFVLQDLSIRTEGWFRLRMCFMDVKDQTVPGTMKVRSKGPILAHVFSEKFQVFSAKKFPGVIESTPLSKCFAAQGIKIPIRKDGARAERDADDED